jgi:hypothetical protein
MLSHVIIMWWRYTFLYMQKTSHTFCTSHGFIEKFLYSFQHSTHHQRREYTHIKKNVSTGNREWWQSHRSSGELFCGEWRSVTLLIIERKKVLSISISFRRSSYKVMVSRQQSGSTHIDTCHLSLLLPLRRPTIHEKPKTIPTQKHIDRLQHCTSCFQHHSRCWGKFFFR